MKVQKRYWFVVHRRWVAHHPASETVGSLRGRSSPTGAWDEFLKRYQPGTDLRDHAQRVQARNQFTDYVARAFKITVEDA